VATVTGLESGLRSVRSRARAAAERAGRDPDSIRLVVVGKGHEVGQLRSLYELGQRDFGENRAQELAAKVDQLPADISWHFVGPLQTNKVRLVRPVVSMLHSLDRIKLAAAWMKGPGLPPPALLQVNIGREPQKGGVDPEAVAETVDQVLRLGVPLRGLMAIPPLGTLPADSRPYFRRLATLRADLVRRHPQLDELSMGMTDDFEVAVEEGATVIRVGRAIFAATEQ
jgi:pyridoxal phosphate enzyme (YggS family)